MAASADFSATFLLVKLLRHSRREEPTPEEPFKRDYDVHVQRSLGKGMFGEVFKGTRKSTQEDVAIKVFRFRRAESRERA